jgi:phospholipid/cholesterol/gamma-HCH transport system permease protein
MTVTTTPRERPGTMEEIGELTIYAGRTIRSLPGAARYSSEVFRQLSLLIRSTTLLVAAMVMFIAIAATNYGYYFLKSAGASDYIGLINGLAGPRLEAALVFGYAFAAKVGCGIVGEIGSMKVNEELDAYDSEGVTARRFVVATRVLAALLYTPIITPVALLAANLGAYVQTVFVLHAVPAQTFFHFDWANQAVGDQLFTFVMIFFVAMVIVLVSCYYGTTTRGGPAGVGASVARSLVINLVMIHVILGLGDFFVYGTTLGLPIGG